MKKSWRSKLTADKSQLTKVLYNFCQLSVVVLLAIATACSSDKQTKNTDTYICPMHPTVVSDRPSTCPVCGMDLVRKARPGEEVKITEELARLIKSPNEVIISSISTVKTEYKSIKETVRVQGIVTYDTRKVYNIPARTGGRLEKVYLKYTFQPVHKGQRVADIYSPELLTAQRELLYLIENDKENAELIQSAKNKLLLLGISEKQLEEIITGREPKSAFTIFSQQDGYVIRASVSAPTLSIVSTASTPVMDDSMSAGIGSVSNSKGSPVSSSTDLIREGSYVTTGQTLFNVVNTSALRIELNLGIAQAGSVKAGDEILLNLGDSISQTAKVDFVQPFFTEGEEFVKLRVIVQNKDQLRIGQLVSATYQVQTMETLWLPKEAVLDMGLDKIVFIKERGGFKPKKIITGIQVKDSIEVKQGLASVDEVAVNAQYLVDSESFIKSK